MKIGLYFGTFNPVHIGHMIIAQYMLEYSDLDEVWFVVTPHNPFKKKSTLLDDRQRLHMVHLAIGDHFKLRASDIEFGLEQPNYTINTLNQLQDKYPDKAFALIMGQDNLAGFHKWKDPEKIIEKCDLYVYPRPGAKPSQFDDYPEVHRVNAPLMELSSTQIRAAVKEGKDVSYMLPPAVWEYIGQCGFYKEQH
jgi:nicotinate-nucleotide adenylyltransferase